MMSYPFQSAENRCNRALTRYELKRMPPSRAEVRAANLRRNLIRGFSIATAFVLCLAAVWFANRVHAAGFEVAASPARFVLSGKSSGRLGQSIDIYNVGATATEVSVRTIDWSYSEDGKLTFHDELMPNSCRPWVTLERKTVKIAARSKKSFRFQFEVPPDASRSECRLMLAIEGVEPAHKALIEGGNASMSLPVNGRIAVAVYFAVNGAEPKLEMKQVQMAEIGGKRVPAIAVTNTGDAHGRLDGGLDTKDANGLEFELVPDGTPIMPGQTRVIALSPKADGDKKPPALAFPLQTKGTLDWDRGSFKIAAEFRQ